MFLIKRRGNLVWDAELEDAGPYYLGTPFQIFATFGARSPRIGTPGTPSQQDAFEQSRAAFESLDTLVDLSDLTAAELKPLVRAATKAARAEWRRWEHTIHRIGGAQYIAGYQGAVTDRLDRELF